MDYGRPGQFYGDIFTVEVDEGPVVSLQTATVCDNIDLTEKLILEKLNSLDLSKSPGCIHEFCMK